MGRGLSGGGSGNLITAEPAKRLARAVRERAKAETLVLTQLLMLRNIIGPEEQLNITHILGKDWKYQQEVRLRPAQGRGACPSLVEAAKRHLIMWHPTFKSERRNAC